MEQYSASDCLSPDEFKQQLAKLSVTDLSKIMAVTKAKHVSGTGMEYGDLLAETIARVLAGSRKVPRDVSIVAYLIQTIRSIAFTERKKRGKAAKDGEITLISWEGEYKELAELAPSCSSPEQILEEAESSKYYDRKIEELFISLTNDPNALAVLQGRMDELSPSEIKGETKMSHHAYDAARKKVGRALLRIEVKRTQL